MNARAVPEPSPMGIDTQAWANEVNLSNMVNVHYEYRDALELDDVRKVLLIGVTNGVEADFLSSRGLQVTTFDIDPTFGPDELGSCDDLSRFSDRQFDLVIASHVLEHLPLPRLDVALREIARVARFALIYLPVAGRCISVRVAMGSRRSWTFRLDLYRYWHRPSGVDRVYRFGEHYWEVGYRGFRKTDIRKRLERYFRVVREYRNPDWLPSFNFVLSSLGAS